MKILNLQATLVNIEKQLNTHFYHESLREALGLKRLSPQRQTSGPTKDFSSRQKLSVAQYILIFLDFKNSQTTSFKHFYYYHKLKFQVLFNQPIASYSRCCLWINRLGEVFKTLLFSLKINLSNKQLALIDSCVLPTSELYCWGKVHRLAPQKATVAYSSTGKHFGLKLHLLTDQKGAFVNACVSSGKTHDLDPIKYGGFLNDQSCTLLADSGYLSQELYFELMQKNALLIAKPRIGMGHASNYSFDAVSIFERYKKHYPKRFLIERIFNLLQHYYGLKLNRTHSPKAAQTIIWGALFMFYVFYQSPPKTLDVSDTCSAWIEYQTV